MVVPDRSYAGLNHCARCTTTYALGLVRCPHCGSDELEDVMPKTTVHGGPSYAGVDSPAAGQTPEETSQDPQHPYVKPAEDEKADGGETTTGGSTEGGNAEQDDSRRLAETKHGHAEAKSRGRATGGR